VTALAAIETHLRRRNNVDAPYTVSDAVAQLVRFRPRIEPKPGWVDSYRRLRGDFDARLSRLQSGNGVAAITRAPRPARKTSNARKSSRRRSPATTKRAR
jgi:hypothetical protein